MVKTSAAVVVTILLAIALYQIALAAGAAPAEPALATQRRGRTELSWPYRVVSVIAGGVMVLAALVVAARGELVLVLDGALDDQFLTWGTFGVGAYLAVNAITDLGSTNAVKRWVASAAKTIAAALCAIVAFAPQTALTVWVAGGCCLE